MKSFNQNFCVANIVESSKDWIDYKQDCIATYAKGKTARIRVANNLNRVDWNSYNLNDYIFTHNTIVASVCHDEMDNHTITEASVPTINANENAWTNEVLGPPTNIYRTFVGAENFYEHVQDFRLSKGKVLDAVLRSVKNNGGEKVWYCDILVATNRKHRDLVARIAKKELNTLSMGCLANLTTCSRCGKVMRNDWEACNHIRYEIGQEYRTDYGYMSKVAELCLAPDTLIKMGDGTYLPIEEISKGDMVITHKGNKKEVVETFKRHYEGDILEVEVEGTKEILRITPNHPVYAVKSGNRNGVISIDYKCDFVNAEDLVVGDRLTYPVGGEVLIDPNISKEKAWLLGLFAAEGSYIKRNGKKIGVTFTLNWQDEMPLAKKIKSLLEKEFKPQSMVFHKGLKDVILSKRLKKSKKSISDKIWNLLKKNNSEMTSEDVSHALSISHSSSGRLLKNLLNNDRVSKRKLNENERPEIKGRKRSNCYVWKAKGDVECARYNYHYSNDNSNINFSFICPGCGSEEKEIRQTSNGKLRCRVCKSRFDKETYIKPIVSFIEQDNGYKKLQVSYTNQEAADFLFDLVGEYSWKKEFKSDVVSWPTYLQEEIIKGWFIGDGTKTHGGCLATTASFNMYSQFHTMISRCGFWVRSQVMYEGKSSLIANCVNGEAVDVGGRLCRPSYGLSIYKKDVISLGLKNENDFPLKEGINHYSKEIPTYRIKSIKRKSYSGFVHNIAVNEDNSYVSICGSVHNCGLQGDPDSCRFIEASWVEAPAFKGAVVNHYVSVPTIRDFVENNVIDFDQATKAIRRISAGDINTLKRVRVADHRSMAGIRLFIEELQRAGRFHRIHKIAEDLLN